MVGNIWQQSEKEKKTNKMTLIDHIVMNLPASAIEFLGKKKKKKRKRKRKKKKKKVN